MFVLQTRLYVRAILNILENVYNVPKCAGSFLTKEDENFPVHDFPPSLPKNSTTKKKKKFFPFRLHFILLPVNLKK